MNPWDVHEDEMSSRPLDHAAVEAFLAGRASDATTGELGPLTAFADDLSTAVQESVPRATPQLAALLASGLEGEPEGFSTPAEQPTWRKKRMTVTELLAALTAKLAGLGMAAKAALGLGAAALMTTTAAAAGVLPDPAQHAVASVVNAVSPFDVPDGTSGAAGADEDDPDTATTTTPETTTTLPGGDDEGTDDPAGAPANHGACVSETARSAPRGPGGVHGAAVSEAARSDCGKDGDDDGTTTTTSLPTTVTSDDIDGDDSSNRGFGNGNGNDGNRGPGSNSGSGNSGSGSGNTGSGGSKGGN